MVTQRGQVERIVEEIRLLCGRVGVAVQPPPKPNGDQASSVCDAVEWAFRARHALVGVAASTRWRDSFTRLEPPRPDDELSSEYQRAELTIRPGSGFERVHPWLRRPEHDFVVRFVANGMAAVGAFVLGVARWAGEIRRPVTLLTTPLYHETRQLLGSWLLDGRIETHSLADAEELLEAVETAESPVALFLDSAETVDTVALLERLARTPASGSLIAIGWDSTCVPFHAEVPASRLPAPLVAMRSHIKLDQLGYEVGPLGSIVVVQGARLPAASTSFLEGFLPRLPLHCRLLGVNASADLIRRLGQLSLPDDTRTPISNAALRAANLVGAEVLAASLSRNGRQRIVRYPHRCFAAIELRASEGETSPDRVLARAQTIAAAVHEHGQRERLPIIGSASFGFPFTAVTGFAVERGEGAVPVLRVAFGGHDSPVTERVATAIASVVSAA